MLDKDQEITVAEIDLAQLVVANAKSILIKNNKRATGNLINSIRYYVNAKGEVKVTYAKEGKYVIQGRKPNGKFPWPNGDSTPILRWIKQKGIKGRDRTTGRFITDRSLTFLISRGIAKNGIKPLPFISMAVKEAKKQINSARKKQIAKAAVKKFKDAFKKESKP